MTVIIMSLSTGTPCSTETQDAKLDELLLQWAVSGTRQRPLIQENYSHTIHGYQRTS